MPPLFLLDEERPPLTPSVHSSNSVLCATTEPSASLVSTSPCNAQKRANFPWLNFDDDDDDLLRPSLWMVVRVVVEEGGGQRSSGPRSSSSGSMFGGAFESHSKHAVNQPS